MDEEDISLFIKEIDPSELFSNNNKKVCRALNYIEHFLILCFHYIGSLFGLFRNDP